MRRVVGRGTLAPVSGAPVSPTAPVPEVWPGMGSWFGFWLPLGRVMLQLLVCQMAKICSSPSIYNMH